MVLYEHSLRKDTWDTKLDANLAPEISDVVLKKAHAIYSNPDQFFSITYFSLSMQNLIKQVSNNLRENKGEALIITSLFGGGKTHSLIALYHSLTSPNVAKQHGFEVPEGVKVIVVGGKDSGTAPSPVAENNKIKTLWGYIADKLGKYDLVKNEDQDLISPSKDKLEMLFEGEKVVILVDEIAWYLQRLEKTENNKSYSKYYEQCLLFFEALAQVTVSKPLILIITLPAAVRKDVVEAEIGYDEVVTALWKRIQRVGMTFESPISNEIDLASMLKKRIFEGEIQVPLDLLNRYRKKAEDFKNILDTSILDELEKTYPFHPLYVRVLQRILEVHRGLQKSRDAIRITRMVIRKLYQKKPSRDLVLPSDIDVRESDIENLLLNQYTQFANVVTEMKNSIKGLDINFLLANYIFLSTYVFSLGMNPGKYLANLPDNKEIVTSLLDLSLLSSANLTPSDIFKILTKIAEGSVLIPYLIHHEGRYWFTYFADPKTLCANEARSVNEIDVLKEFEKSINDITYKGKDDSIILSSSSYRIVPTIEDLIDDDHPKYKVVIIRDPVDERELKDKAKTFIFWKELKKPRTYSNTISLIVPTRQDIKNNILSTIKLYLGCEKVNVEMYYTDEIARKVAEGMLKTYVNSKKTEVQGYLIPYFSNLAFPVDINQVGIDQLSAEGKNLLERTESTLRSANKLLEELNFGSLSYYLEQISVNLYIDRQNYSNIISSFYTNPKLPWVREDVIKKALLEGVQMLKIGILTDQEVYFKRAEVQDLSIEIIKDNSLILPPRNAANLEIDELIKKEIFTEDGDSVLHKYYVLELDDGSEIPLRDLKNDGNWFEKFKIGRLKLKEEKIEKGVDIRVKPLVIEAFKGKVIDVEVSILKIGSFNDEVEVVVQDSHGNMIKQVKVTPNSSFIFSIKVENNNKIEIIAKYSGKEKSKEIPIIVNTEPDIYEIPPHEFPQNGKLEKIEYPLESSQDVTTLTRTLVNIYGAKKIVGEITLEDNKLLDNKSNKSIIVNLKVNEYDILEFGNLVRSALTIVGGPKAKLYGNISVIVERDKPLEDNEKELLKKLTSNKGKAYVRVIK